MEQLKSNAEPKQMELLHEGFQKLAELNDLAEDSIGVTYSSLIGVTKTYDQSPNWVIDQHVSKVTDSLRKWMSDWLSEIEHVNRDKVIKQKMEKEKYKYLFGITDITGLNKLESYLRSKKFLFKLSLLPWYEEDVDLNSLIRTDIHLSPFRYYIKSYMNITKSYKVSLDSYVDTLISIIIKDLRSDLLKNNIGHVLKSEKGDYLIYTQPILLSLPL